MSIVTKTYWCDFQEYHQNIVEYFTRNAFSTISIYAFVYTFFRWFYLPETTLRYFHFLFFLFLLSFILLLAKMLKMRQTNSLNFDLWLVFCCYCVCHLFLSMYALLSLCHSIAMNFEISSLNTIHTLYKTSLFAVSLWIKWPCGAKIHSHK